MYQRILLEGQVFVDDNSNEQIELLLTGLVVNSHGVLQVKNRIYQCIFSSVWIDCQLKTLRPYARQIQDWLNTERQDPSLLLQGQDLEEANAWAGGKSLSEQDYQYLRLSQELEIFKLRQSQVTLRQRNRRLTFWGSAVAASLTVISGLTAVTTHQHVNRLRLTAQLERDSSSLLQLFESSAPAGIDVLFAAMRNGQQLREITGQTSSVSNYPTVSPLFALHQILFNIREQNRVVHNHIVALKYSPDGM